MPSAGLEQTQGGDRLFPRRDGDPRQQSDVLAQRSKVTTAASPRQRSDVLGVNGDSSPSPTALPVLSSPTLSAQVPLPPSPSVQIPPTNSSIDKNCAPSQAPPVAHGSHDHL